MKQFRVALSLLALVAGCGRLSVNPADVADAAAGDAGGAPVGRDGGGSDGGLDLARGCAVRLAMDEAGWSGVPGEVSDGCGNGNNGTAVAGAARIDDPVRGRVGEFPSPSGCVEIPDAPSLHATTGLTMTAWINPQVLDDMNPFGVIAKRTDYAMDDAEYTLFVWTNNTVFVDLNGHANRRNGTLQLTKQVWQQVTAVFDGSQPQDQRLRIYVNGALDSVLDEPVSTLAAFSSSLSIGCLPLIPTTDPQLALAGQMNDVGVWTRAFTADEVSALYQATLH